MTAKYGIYFYFLYQQVGDIQQGSDISPLVLSGGSGLPLPLAEALSFMERSACANT